MKPEAQPRRRQDSQRDKDALVRTTPKGDWPTRHPRTKAAPACLLTRARSNTPTTSENIPAALCGASLEAWCGISMARLSGVSVNRPS